MIHHTFIQGSEAWHAHRAKSRNASDAPAMLGCSPYQTRGQLLQRMHTGLAQEVDAATQRIFDTGHAIEADQRAAAEELIGEELFPVVGSATVDGIELSASFDGLNMLEDTGYECKTLNDALREALGPDLESNDPSALPKAYRVQMEQQLAVSGADRVLFVAANRDGTDVRRCWYYPDLALRAEIIAGWKQLDADLAAYTPPTAAPVVVAQPVQALPAVSVQVTGAIAITENFGAFEQAVRDFLEHRLIREPKTDQDFADLDVQIKAMKGAEAALEAAEAQMLAQIQTVDQAKKTKDMLAKLVRDNRLMAEKLLASEKERRRGEIVAGGITDLRKHIESWNAKLGKAYMPTIAADFGGVIRGLKSLASMEDKVATELARARGAADRIGATIEANLATLRELAKDHVFLFADAATLVLKATDDCRATVVARIADHKAAEERRAAELAERERERIRLEEAARIEKEQQDRIAAEKRRRDEEAALQLRNEQNAAAAAAIQSLDEARRNEALPAPVLDALDGVVTGIMTDLTIGRAADSAAKVVPMQRAAAPAAPQPATLNLGAICDRLGFTVSADFLRRLGIEPAAVDKSAKKFTERQFQQLCTALISHIGAVAREQNAA